jgi:hypothetical protein
MLSSIRIRLTALYVTIFGALLIVFSFNVYSQLASDLHERFDNSLFRTARAAAKYFEEFAEKDSIPKGAIETVRDSQLGDSRLAVFLEHTVLSSGDPGIAPSVNATGILNRVDGTAPVVFTTDASRRSRLAAVTLIVGSRRYSIVVAEPLAELETQLARDPAHLLCRPSWRSTACRGRRFHPRREEPPTDDRHLGSGCPHQRSEPQLPPRHTQSQ